MQSTLSEEKVQFYLAEWIDFPRGPQSLPNGSVIPGNNYSYDKCRRRFDLVSLTTTSFKYIQIGHTFIGKLSWGGSRVFL